MQDSLVLTDGNELEKVQNHPVIRLWEDIHNYQIQEVAENLLTPFPDEKEGLRMDEVCIYQVEKLAYDEEHPQREAFENVLMSLDNKAFNFLYILTGDESGISLYIGVVKNQSPNAPVLDTQLSASNYGEIVANSFKGNFNGSQLKRILGEENVCQLLTKDLGKYKNVGVITGIPTVFEKDLPSEYDFQGIDRLINSMLETNWRLVVVCEPVDKEEILRQQRAVYEFYNWLTTGAEMSVQVSETSGKNYSEAHQISDTRGKNEGVNRNETHGKGYSSGSGNNTSYSSARGTSTGTSVSHTDGNTTTRGGNAGKSSGITMKFVNKQKQELMKYIDEEMLERLKIGLSRGMFKTAVYYMADKPAYADRLQAGIKAIGKGNHVMYSPLVAQRFDVSRYPDIIRSYQNVEAGSDNINPTALMLLGRPCSSSTVGLSTFLTPQEVSVLAGLPQKEVPGIPLQEGVSFGLNENSTKIDGRKIEMGCIVQKNRHLDIKFHLDTATLSKHTFVGGVTGSGKTTTCHRLLKEARVPFMVIEPAKTEYRTLISQNTNFGDVIVFTVGNEQVAPFRLNPFELMPGENIPAHIDMLKAVFTSAFPMEGSMPQLIEEALLLCYDRRGWDITTNKNIIYGDSAYDEPDSFPVMSELLPALKKVVSEKKFGSRLQSEYEGTLISRFSNLTQGVKGNMLNCARSLDFKKLAHHNVVIEMDEIKTPEDKALFMGFILSKMSAVIRAIHKETPDFRHLTLIEEAHRLLSKVEPGSGSAKKSAVETFTDLLAEVRKYGEGIIVVDQIPNKLAPEVLKNTNTKIIHRLFARDDKEAVGDTMLMDDKQKEYLSALSVGEAIIFTENTDKPVQLKIEPISDTNEAEISNSFVKKNFDKYFNGEKQELGACYNEHRMQSLYRPFKKLLDAIYSLKENEHLTKEDAVVCSMYEAMKKVGEDYNYKEEEIWWQLLHDRDRALGKIIDNPPENLEQRNQYLVEQLGKLASKDGITQSVELQEKIGMIV